jgi:hypothetical protein
MSNIPDYISAPHIPVLPVEQDTNDESVDKAVEPTTVVGDGPRGWWFSREEKHFKAIDKCDIDIGFDQSVQHVLNAIKEKVHRFIGVTICYYYYQGPYDGIFGFSQGACMTALLLAMKERNGDI